MANTITYAKVFQKELDKQVLEGSTSGWMEENASQVIYNGGNEIKMPKMSLQGLAATIATRVTPAALLHIPTRLSRSHRTEADVSVSTLSTLMRAALDWRRQMLRLSSSALR